MRDAFFILLVILLLLAITAVKYRRQIAGMIGVVRALKEAASGGLPSRAVEAKTTSQPSVQLVNCAKCGVWVPETKAIGRGGRPQYCERCGREAT